MTPQLNKSLGTCICPAAISNKPAMVNDNTLYMLTCYQYMGQ